MKGTVSSLMDWREISILANQPWVLGEGGTIFLQLSSSPGKGNRNGGVEELFHSVEFCKCCVVRIRYILVQE